MALSTRVLKTVEMEGNTYRIHAMTLFQQFHVSAKLSTVLMGLTAIKAQTADLPRSRFARALLAMSGNLSDDDREFCVRTCLGSVERQTGPGWQGLMTGGDRPMFEDITLLQSLELMYDVLDAHDMPSFFAAAPATSDQGAPPQG